MGGGVYVSMCGGWSMWFTLHHGLPGSSFYNEDETNTYTNVMASFTCRESKMLSLVK